MSSLNCPAFFLGFLSMRFEEIWVEVLGRRRTSAPYLTFRWDFWVLRPMPIFAMCENLLPAAFDDIGAAVLCRIRKRCCCGGCSDVHSKDLEVIRVEVFFAEYRFPLFSTQTALLCVCVYVFFPTFPLCFSSMGKTFPSCLFLFPIISTFYITLGLIHRLFFLLVELVLCILKICKLLPM